MKKLSDLQDFFYANIYPELEELELKRVKIYASLKKIAVIIFSFAFILFYLLFNAFLNPIELFVSLSIVSFIIFGFIYKLKVSGYAYLFKDQIIRRIVEFIDDSLYYNKLGMISRYDYMTSGIFPQRVDRYQGDDLVKGKIHGVDMSFSELHTEIKKRGNKGKIYWQSIFRGLFFIADFNKDFMGKTIVLPDNSEKFIGTFAHIFQSFNSRGELVKMDSPNFEKEFVVYSDDQIEARYILTHSLMEAILRYQKLIGKSMYISFVGSKIYIAIAFNEKLFEPKIYKKVTNFDEIKLYFEIISLTSDIVKDLNLDKKLWSKR